LVAQIDKNFLIARPWKIWPRLLAYALFEGRPLTTRGRWINPLVFAGYRLWACFPQPRRAQNPVFIYGVGRSGTTVLGTILALHRHVGYLNEPKALWHAALGDDDLIGSYSAHQGRFRMSHSDYRASSAQRLRRFYNAYLRLSASRRVVDKYPELLFRDGLINAIFPGARKIVLIRNGADTCQSIENWSKRHGRGGAQASDDWWGRDRRKWHALLDQLVENDPYFAGSFDAISGFERHVDMAAVEWVVAMREVLALRRQADSNIMFVRYETLAAQPRAVMGDILKFCDLAPDETMLAYGEKTLRVNPPYPALVLDPAIRHLFDATMRELGYASGQPA